MKIEPSDPPLVASVQATRAMPRVLFSAAAGVVVGSLTLAAAPWEVAALAGWDTMALVLVVWVVLATWNLDSASTAALATREDDSPAAADVILLSACIASLIAVAFGLVKAGQEHGLARAGITAMAVLGVFLAWGSVHGVFTLRYARLYYTSGGGIDFNEDDDPDYRDFMYLALTVGMTYQVSDTDLQNKTVRRTVTRHGILSFLFGTVIVATMINVVASLLR